MRLRVYFFELSFGVRPRREPTWCWKPAQTSVRSPRASTPDCRRRTTIPVTHLLDTAWYRRFFGADFSARGTETTSHCLDRLDPDVWLVRLPIEIRMRYVTPILNNLRLSASFLDWEMTPLDKGIPAMHSVEGSVSLPPTHFFRKKECIGKVCLLTYHPLMCGTWRVVPWLRPRGSLTV